MADGFGRVNLIIGKNDCGKTALMEALEIADGAEDAARLLDKRQKARLGRGANAGDFERYWRPLFFNLDAEAGFSISALHDDNGEWRTLEVRQGAPLSEIVSRNEDTTRAPRDDWFGRPNWINWSLDLRLTQGG